MYELTWQVVSSEAGTIEGGHRAPQFALKAALEAPVAVSLASLQLLQSHARLADAPALSISSRSAVGRPLSRHASSPEVC